MNTKEILARRRNTGEVSRMTIPVDPDTTRRLRAVIVGGHTPLPWWRRLLRWFKF